MKIDEYAPPSMPMKSANERSRKVPAPSTPAEFAAYVKAETAKWGKVVRDSGAKPE